MSDITTKLRQGQCSFDLNGEACREIDRLREELKDTRADRDEIHRALLFTTDERDRGDRALYQIREKDAEIARLREALAKIVEQQTQHPRDEADRVEWHAYWRDAAGKRHDIARAALAQVAESQG